MIKMTKNIETVRELYFRKIKNKGHPPLWLKKYK